MMRAADAEVLEAEGSSDPDAVPAKVSEIVKSFGKGDLGASDNLEAAGFSSLDFVNLMLTVEESFAMKIPSARMTPGNFRTIGDIEALVRSLVQG